ncbi:unnamed protein product [Linum tenue]|uniref:Uncharacterized protein n=1 Tax=Linum tenue TaxID=586396 RepID=A0AAV0P5B0_9ROSI|nr:unnamed protein product [Linum tenue]
MASSLVSHSRAAAAARSPLLTRPPAAGAFSSPLEQLLLRSGTRTSRSGRALTGLRVRVSSNETSYLDMWKNAIERERKAAEFQKIADTLPPGDDGSAVGGGEQVDLEKKNEEFSKILDVSDEERDRIRHQQVIDRAAAAIAAAESVVKGMQERAATFPRSIKATGDSDPSRGEDTKEVEGAGEQDGGIVFIPKSADSSNGVPGPDFWSWTPPKSSDSDSNGDGGLQPMRQPSASPVSYNPVKEKERGMDFLTIPFESKLPQIIPPLQSSMEVENLAASEPTLEIPAIKEEVHELGEQFSAHAAEAARALQSDLQETSLTTGVNPDGSRWWKQVGAERRPDGVICRWTMSRGVSADQETEWQEKFWEASDDFGYKELGSEKSGRDANGSVWREHWRESMWQDAGLVHLEKTADKWGKNGQGDEWQEQWWEHYDASNKAEKWAHKWCSIDPTTPLDAGHAHVWHEKWGEKYDGHGGSAKYTDKWAERWEGDGWAKWGDKWDEDFSTNGHGVKQGETWWAGKYGDRWNRTWGEQHNGTGWIHKYGQSSCGEHWDTHIPQDTWYERFPHFGFYHCFDHSTHLQQVKPPSEIFESGGQSDAPGSEPEL